MNMLNRGIKIVRKNFVCSFSNLSNLENLISSMKGIDIRENEESVNDRIAFQKVVSRSFFSPVKTSKSFFNKYSRHSNILQEATSARIKAFLKSFCRICCISTNETVQELICNLYLTHHGNSSASEELLELNPKCVFTETCITTASKSQVVEGILVSINSKNDLNFRLLQSFKTSFKNVVLLNTISYGVNLPGLNDVTIIENISLKDYNSSRLPVQSQVISTILKLNVDVIIHRGDLNPTLVSELNRLGIIDLHVKSYRQLHCLSKLLSVNICYDFEDLTSISVGNVEISKISYLAESVKNKTENSDNTSYFMKFRCQSTQVQYYTVVLCERSLDLTSLLLEEFNFSLRRIQFVLKTKTLVLGYAENRIISILRTEKFNNAICPTTTWIENEMSFFVELIKERVINVFKSYLQLFKDNEHTRPRVEGFQFRAALWEESLKCASILMKTKVVEVDF